MPHDFVWNLAHLYYTPMVYIILIYDSHVKELMVYLISALISRMSDRN